MDEKDKQIYFDKELLSGKKSLWKYDIGPYITAILFLFMTVYNIFSYGSKFYDSLIYPLAMTDFSSNSYIKNSFYYPGISARVQIQENLLVISLLGLIIILSTAIFLRKGKNMRIAGLIINLILWFLYWCLDKYEIIPCC